MNGYSSKITVADRIKSTEKYVLHCILLSTRYKDTLTITPEHITGLEFQYIEKKGTPSQVDSHQYGPADRAIDGRWDGTWSDQFDLLVKL